jgi:hypothetical protein
MGRIRNKNKMLFFYGQAKIANGAEGGRDEEEKIKWAKGRRQIFARRVKRCRRHKEEEEERALMGEGGGTFLWAHFMGFIWLFD